MCADPELNRDLHGLRFALHAVGLAPSPATFVAMRQVGAKPQVGMPGFEPGTGRV